MTMTPGGVKMKSGDAVTPSSMILGNERRTLLVRYLQSCDGKADLRDIVDFIAKEEGKVDRRHRKSVYVSLVQTHIPKMERAGMIRFDHHVVTLLKIPENVDVYMEVVEKHDISWSAFYAGISVIFGITGLWFNNIPLVVVSGIYLILSIIQHFRTYRVFSSGNSEE